MVTWGNADHGGDSSQVREKLVRVKHIQATEGAFAATLHDGSVVTWVMAVTAAWRKSSWLASGRSRQLSVLLQDGFVVAWGHAGHGCDSSLVQEQLAGARQIQATERAFAAMLDDGSVVSWGNAGHGGDSSLVQEQLADVRQVQATERAFAAILDNGSVVTWDHPKSKQMMVLSLPSCWTALW